MNVADAFANVAQGDAVDLRTLETELSVPLLGMTQPMDAQTQSAIEDTIVAALLQRSCNPIQMHLRLKKGFGATFAYDELNELPTSANDVARELARFYVRIAVLRGRILQEMQMQPSALTQESLQGQASARMQRAYTAQIENMHNKQRENQEQLARIMQGIITNPNPDSDASCIHAAVTPADLEALDMQVQDIAERGCAANEMRCLKILEAAIEQQKYDALIAELHALEQM